MTLILANCYNCSKCFFVLILSGLLISGCQSKSGQENKIPEIPTENSYSEAVRLKALTDAITSNPSDPENFFRRSVLHYEMGNLKPAYDDALRACAIDSNQGKYYLTLAKIFVKLPNLTEADRAIKKAVLKGMDTPDLHVTQGQIFYIQKKYQLALEALNKALKVAESYAPAYLYKGLVYAEIGDTAKAISSLQTAIEQSPDQIDAYSKLYTLWTARGKTDLAKQYLVSGLRFAPRDPFIYIGLGDYYERQNELDTAKEYYKKAAFFEPELYVSYLHIGRIAAKKLLWAEAVAAFKLAVDYSTTDVLPRLYLAQALAKNQQFEEALFNYRKILELNSGYIEEANIAIKWLEPLVIKLYGKDSTMQSASPSRGPSKN